MNKAPDYKNLLKRILIIYPAKDIRGWAQIFLAGLLSSEKDYSGALQYLSSTASLFPDSELEAQAYYEMFNIYFFALTDFAKSENMLNSMKLKYPKSTLTHTAMDIQSSINNSGNHEQILAKQTEDLPKISKTFELAQNYPNPFNPTTTIKFTLPEKNKTTLVIYNMLGQVIRTFHLGHLDNGAHWIVWNGKDKNGHTAASGVYIYELMSGKNRQVKKMLLLR